jgi:hypothetical protein
MLFFLFVRPRAAREGAPAEARVPGGAEGPEPVPGGRHHEALRGDGGSGSGTSGRRLRGRRHGDVSQRVHDREGEDGPGAVRARQAAPVPAPAPPPAAAAAQRRGRWRVPVVVFRDHVLREAPRRRGAGRRLRLALRRRDGGRGVPQVLPVRAHLPERPAVPALRVPRPGPAGAGAGREQEAADRPQRRLPGHIACGLGIWGDGVAS